MNLFEVKLLSFDVFGEFKVEMDQKSNDNFDRYKIARHSLNSIKD